ncbi:MAG: dipeptide epimerase [Planctomycetes bacterium]|nr:dipeptide epimerase [Planctomycetota bacterium]
MRLRTRVEELRLRHTFTISRGSQDLVPVVIAEVESDGRDGGIVGTGEASPSSFYGEDAASVRAALEALEPWLAGADPRCFHHVLEEAAARLGKARGALCALDLALHDLAGRLLGLPLHRMLGLDPARVPGTSFTIGIDALDVMVSKLREARGYPIIKIKLGTPRDLEVVRALRRETSAVFRVDANCAWTARETIEKSRELKALGVEFIEQPLPPAELEAMEEVHAKAELPVVADESSVVPEDVPGLRGRFHGINIKLVKCGGILPALRMIHLARTFGLKVMIGCMIESSVACTAAAQIGPLVDYLDIDGPLLITNDPYRGVEYRGGELKLPAGPGLGVVRRAGA